MKGEALRMGDKAVTGNDIWNDLSQFLLGNSDFKAPQEIINKLTNDKDGRFTENFLKAYIETRNWDSVPVKFIFIEQAIQQFKIKDPLLFQEYFIDKTVGNLNLGIDGRDIVNFCFGEIPELLKLSPQVSGEQIIDIFEKTIDQANRRLVRSVYQMQYDQADNEDRSILNYFFEVFMATRAVKLLRIFQNLEVEVARTDDDLSVMSVKKDSKLLDYLTDFYKQFIKEAGWGKRPTVYATQLDTLLNDFPVSFELRQYVAQLVSKELKLDFHFTATKEQLVEGFHQSDQTVISEIVNDARKSGQSIDAVLQYNVQGKNFTWDHFARYAEFVTQYLEEQLTLQFPEKIQKLKDDLGDHQAGIVIGLLCDPISHQFVDSLSEEEIKIIELQAQARIEGLLKRSESDEPDKYK